MHDLDELERIVHYYEIKDNYNITRDELKYELGSNFQPLTYVLKNCKIVLMEEGYYINLKLDINEVIYGTREYKKSFEANKKEIRK